MMLSYSVEPAPVATRCKCDAELLSRTYASVLSFKHAYIDCNVYVYRCASTIFIPAGSSSRYACGFAASSPAPLPGGLCITLLLMLLLHYCVRSVPTSLLYCLLADMMLLCCLVAVVTTLLLCCLIATCVVLLLLLLLRCPVAG